MNKMTKFLSMALILSLTVLFSCKKDNDKGPSGSHKVVFKAIGSNGVGITTAVYTDGKGNNETFTSLTGSTWTSAEYTVPASAMVVNFGANGQGPQASSTLVTEIWVDGVKKAEGKSTGTILSASATYSFN